MGIIDRMEQSYFTPHEPPYWLMELERTVLTTTGTVMFGQVVILGQESFESIDMLGDFEYDDDMEDFEVHDGEEYE